MSDADKITVFHSPQSRSAGAVALLEELGAPYELRVLNMMAGDQRQPAFLAINPMGKVPAILHRGQLVTEQVAIFIHLADLFPAARLAPPVGDPLRGPYLRWLVYYAACYEPAVTDRAMQREAAPPGMSPYGDFETMFSTFVAQIADRPYLLGDQVCAADILWGLALHWGALFKVVPENPTVARYVESIVARPGLRKVAQMDEGLAAEHRRAVGAS